jgi:HEAT repeat protein
MGLFDGLFGKKDEGAEIRKLLGRTKEKFGPAENRQKALEQLIELGSPEALAALCQRFTIRVEPGITDDEEKQYCYEALVEAGEKAVEPLKAFVDKSEQPTWALKALDKLLPADALVEVILHALEKEGPDWTRDPEKKITLLRHLNQLQDVRIAPRLVPFFADMNEDVRFAALSVVADQAADDTVREPLIKTLLASQEQKTERIKKQAAQVLAKLAFSVKGFTPAVEAALPPGFSLDKDGVVKAK